MEFSLAIGRRGQNAMHQWAEWSIGHIIGHNTAQSSRR